MTCKWRPRNTTEAAKAKAITEAKAAAKAASEAKADARSKISLRPELATTTTAPSAKAEDIEKERCVLLRSRQNFLFSRHSFQMRL